MSRWNIVGALMFGLVYVGGAVGAGLAIGRTPTCDWYAVVFGSLGWPTIVTARLAGAALGDTTGLCPKADQGARHE